METYEFVINFTHGSALLEFSAANDAEAINHASTQAEAFLSGEDNDLSFESYDDVGSLETIELDGAIVYEAPDVSLEGEASNLLSALEALVEFVDDQGEWAGFPQFVAARAAIKRAKGA